MNILFYYTSNYSAVSLSSLMIEFRKQGHNVSLLTQSTEGDLHNDVKSFGVNCFSFYLPKENSFNFYLKHIRFLANFVKEQKIEIVYSHLQQANIVSVFAQKFCSARFIICRHHSDSAHVFENKNVQRLDSIINRLGREFIVPSAKVYMQMTETEKVNPAKIHLINYAYDFSKYPSVDTKKSEVIREKYKAKLLIIKVARLIPEKRHFILFRVVKKMFDEEHDVKLVVLSEGYLKKDFEKYISENNLSENIFLLGHQKNIMNYLGASDLVIHVSASEASNNLIKEAALAEKPVIACRDVGDFDEYLINGENAILLSKEKTEEELYSVLKKIYSKNISVHTFGKKLKKRITELYSIENIIREYDRFHKI